MRGVRRLARAESAPAMSGGMAPRRKGARAEVQLVAWLRENGYPEARRYLAGDGRQPGDVDGIPGVCMEVKHAERVQLTAWLAQADAEARLGAVPFVVVRLPRVIDPGSWALVTRVRHLPRLVGS